MKVFVAGASGALGRQLVPQLVAAGHDVVGMTRSPGKTGTLRALGARPVVADALDPDAVARVVAEAEPEVIVHELTALTGDMDLKNPEFFATTNRLRTEGTDHLLAAGRAVGIRRFVAQSIATYTTYARVGGPVKTEDAPLDPDPPGVMPAPPRRRSTAALPASTTWSMTTRLRSASGCRSWLSRSAPSGPCGFPAWWAACWPARRR
jgi:2-alkyl-3-oxoalkanoate reductase